MNEITFLLICDKKNYFSDLQNRNFLSEVLNCVNYQHIDYIKMYPFWKKEVLLQTKTNLFAQKANKDIRIRQLL